MEAVIKNQKIGPIGLLGNVAFCLKILFFKINLELDPLFLFYENTIFMPMVVHIPIEAKKYVRPGSGLL